MNEPLASLHSHFLALCTLECNPENEKRGTSGASRYQNR